MQENTIYVPWKGWTVVKRLGVGSYGVVYEIHRLIDEQEEKAAMKVFTIPKSQEEIEHNRDYGYSNESIIKRYDEDRRKVLREYQVMMSLKGHSNIVSCEDVYSEKLREGIGWHIYIRMEFLTPLLKYRKTHAFGENEVRKLGIDLCRALVLCEQKDIVHRDIKPENILVSDFGSFKLGDFGIARTMDHTTAATRTGTMPYMAPEVIRNGHYGRTVDIYSLGIVLYQFLNNFRLPFEPQGDEPPEAPVRLQAYYRRISGEALPSPENGSSGLKKIVKKACEYTPDKRYASAQEMLEDLEGLPQIKPVSKTTNTNVPDHNDKIEAINIADEIQVDPFSKKHNPDEQKEISSVKKVKDKDRQKKSPAQNESKKDNKIHSHVRRIFNIFLGICTGIGILFVLFIILVLIYSRGRSNTSNSNTSSNLGTFADLFPDENFRDQLYDMGIDQNNDHRLSEDEADDVTDISVSGYNIQDLSGIEYFKNLETLYCSANDLTTLDVTQNTKLTTLVCNTNNLYTLDVTKNTKLENLRCFNNSLDFLDLTSNTKLTFLNCRGNLITSLNLANNPDLNEDNVTVDDGVEVSYYQ